MKALMPRAWSQAEMDRCGKAWHEFSDANNLLDGSPTGNRLDDMRLAFEGAWLAAQNEQEN